MTYRFDVRADNVVDQGPVIIIEATPLGQKLIATFTREAAQAALRTLDCGEEDLRHLMSTFADGKERMFTIEVDAEALKSAGFE